MVKDEDYMPIFQSEGRDGLGVRIFVAVPNGRKLLPDDLEVVRQAGYKLYEDLVSRLHKSDLNEIINSQEQSKELLNLFGTNTIYAENIPNEYCDYDRPWLLVTTKVGHIKIGWRKRVMVIDWSLTTNKQAADQLFPNEDVTKYGYAIHAWSYDKAKEYINTIMGLANTILPDHIN